MAPMAQAAKASFPLMGRVLLATIFGISCQQWPLPES
jgi:hypothetical protein